MRGGDPREKQPGLEGKQERGRKGSLKTTPCGCGVQHPPVSPGNLTGRIAGDQEGKGKGENRCSKRHLRRFCTVRWKNRRITCKRRNEKRRQKSAATVGVGVVLTLACRVTCKPKRKTREEEKGSKQGGVRVLLGLHRTH